MGTFDKLQPRFQQAAFWLIALSALLLPIGLGGARTLPFGLMQLGVCGFYVCYALGTYKTVVAYPPLPRRIAVALGLFALVAIWAWLQNQSFTPDAWHHPLWQSASDVLNQPLNGAISLTPEEGTTALARYLTYIAAGFGIYLVARDADNAERLITMFFCMGVVMAVYGLAVDISGHPMILWFDKWSYPEDLTGTFVNRNQYADYAGLTLLAGIGLCWRSLRQAFTGALAHQRAAIWQAWLTKPGLYYIVALIIVAATLPMSHSRAGLMATVFGLIVLVSGYLLHQRRIKIALSIPALIAAVAIAAFLLVPDIGRFATLFSDWSSRDRLSAVYLTHDAILTRPWLGHGLGSFTATFELYRDRTLTLLFTHAHNDWLEALFELGVPAALMLFSGIFLCVSGCWHGIRTRRRHGLYPALGLAASCLILSHALVDFGLQIPGLVTSWLLFLAVGVAQGWSSRQA